MMRLCVMKGQMFAKTPSGLRCKIVFAGDPEYPPESLGVCGGCVACDGMCFNPQMCCSGNRADRRKAGKWIPAPPETGSI